MQLTLTNVLTIVGFIITIVTTIVTNAKTSAIMGERVLHIQSEINELKDSVKEHNGYAKVIPAMQVQIANIEKQMERK